MKFLRQNTPTTLYLQELTLHFDGKMDRKFLSRLRIFKEKFNFRQEITIK